MAARRKALRRPRKATLLAGGNPRIAKGEGPAPVREWLVAVPGWKNAVARRLDTLITRTVPNVRKAVKYNSPLYGLDGRTWFMSLHCFDGYIKVTFFRGASLAPPPPIASRRPGVRYFHAGDTGAFDAPVFASWVKQASALPGEPL